MEEWERFRHDARSDIVAARVLYEHENYGNAAFHCQQALEKMIKAAILKDGTLKLSGRAMGHIPFIKIYENQLPADYKKKLKRDPAYYCGDLTYILVLNTMNSGGFLRTLLWELSLNIPLPELIADNDYYYIPPKHRDPYVIPFELDSKLRLRRLERPSSKSRGEKVNPVEFVFTSFYLDQYSLRRQSKKKTYRADDLLGQVLSLLDLYLMAHPHESMGRYSTEVGDLNNRKMGVVSRNTHEWYKLQRFELKKLIDEIARAVTELDQSLISA